MKTVFPFSSVDWIIKPESDLSTSLCGETKPPPPNAEKAKNGINPKNKIEIPKIFLTVRSLFYICRI